jgi:hypothetical protein
MSLKADYAALKKALGELTEAIDRSQPENAEAGDLLRRMDSLLVDIESRAHLAGAFVSVMPISVS